MAATAAVGGLIAYGIVERVGHWPVRVAMRSAPRWTIRAADWFKTDVEKRRPVSESVRDGWHESHVDLPQSDVPLVRVVAAFLVVWAWTAGIFVLWAQFTYGFSATTYAVGSLVYLALFGIPAGVAMYEMEKRSLPAFILAALAASVPIVLFNLALRSPAGACVMMVIAAVGGVIAYGIVERR